MRLWHKDLIPVLPRQQLLGQWRECCLIAKNISEKGSPGHVLVNKIMDYDLQHFYFYTSIVHDEMKRRGYKADFSKFTKWIKIERCYIGEAMLFQGWFDMRYLRQCYYNLQEKYDCKAITRNEFIAINEKYKEIEAGLL